MEKTMTVGVVTMWVVLGSIIALWMTNVGVNRTEVVECMAWRQQAKEYRSFYLVLWQKEQCDAHGIAIAAPIE